MNKPTYFAFVALCLLATNFLNAQPKPGYAPSSTHIFPAGGQRGTTVEVRVGAECIPPKSNFAIFGNGVQAQKVLGQRLDLQGEPSPRRLPTETPITYPREWQSNIKIAADAKLGAKYWRLSCAQGGTGSRPFIVGDLPEHIERETNSSLDCAETVTIPVTINGQIFGERDVDHFRFAAKQNDVVVCEVFAGRLGSRLDPVVEIVDQRGNRMPTQEIHRGSDPVVAFRATADDDYVLRIAHISTHGSPAHVYRINVSTEPFVVTAFPSGGQANTTRDVDFHLMSGTENDLVVKKKLEFKEGPHDFEFDINRIPNVLEIEPNDTSEKSPFVDAPKTIDGQFASASDQDWFRFVTQDGGAWELVCTSPVGSAASPELLLTDASGKKVSSARSVESIDGICRVNWSAKTNAEYRVRLRDLRFASKGGAKFIYRLSIRRAPVDFGLSLASDCINLMQGKNLTLNLDVKRSGGFNEPIELDLRGLPPTVTVAKSQVPANQNTFKLELSAKEGTPATSWGISIVGTAMIDGKKVQRSVTAKHLGVDSEGIAFESADRTQLHLTVLHKPPFRLFCAEAYMYAHRGSVYPYAMEVERLNGFNGSITLEEGDRQNRDMDGVEIWNTTLNPNETQTHIPIYLPESMHINVQSQTQLYSQGYAHFTDKHGFPQAFLVLSEKRNMLRTLPPVVKLRAVKKELAAKVGQENQCQFRLERTSNFDGEMNIEILDPPASVSSTPAIIPAGANTGQIAFTIPKDATLPLKLTFRATGNLDPNTVVISEDTVTLRAE